MTDQEIICTFMEPRPPLPDCWYPGGWGSPKFWWWLMETPGGGMAWSPWRRGSPLNLNTLWEVEERLTDEQWDDYLWELDKIAKASEVRKWKLRRIAHATPEQKIKALAAALHAAETEQEGAAR